MEHTVKTRFNNKQEFVTYLKETLIPDLKQSGYEATAEDFEEAVLWMEEKKEYTIDRSGVFRCCISSILNQCFEKNFPNQSKLNCEFCGRGFVLLNDTWKSIL